MARTKLKGKEMDVEARIAKKLDKINRNNLRAKSEELLNREKQIIITSKTLPPYTDSDQTDIPSRENYGHYSGYDF